MNERRVIEPNKLGEYISKGDFYLKLDKDGDEKINSRNWREVGRPLTPSLSLEGDRFEKEIYSEVEKEADELVGGWSNHEKQDENNKKFLDLFEKASSEDKIIALKQFKISGEIGEFFLPGEIDLIVFWGSDIGLYDIKASWEEKTYHQIQTSAYSILLRRILEGKNYNLQTGIIHKETDLSFSSIEETPSFSYSAREDDIRRLLSKDGPISRIYDKDINDMKYRIDGGIRESKYGEIAFTESVESKHIRLLGLTRSEQKAFIKEGYETIEDIADMIDMIDSPKPYEHHEIPIKDKHKDSVSRLIEEHRISVNIVQLAQRAQALLAEINPEHPKAFDKPWNLWLHGSGKGNLPDDDPPWNSNNIKEKSLVRVYIDVQHDHVKDFISCISARVTSSKVDYSINESSIIEDIVEERDTQIKYEKDMLSSFFSDLFDSISEVAEDTGWSDDEASFHFYFYTSKDQENLMEACERHEDELNNMRDLLSYRRGIEQPMYSIVHKEIDERIAPKQISTGIIPMMETSFSNEESMNIGDFEYKDSNGDKINLKKAFKTQMFDYRVPVVKKNNGIKVKYTNNADGYYPLLPRFGSNIPLEYIWSVEDIEKLTPEWANQDAYKSIIESYRWVDHRKKERRINKEDIRKMSEKLSRALQHIERSLKFKNTDIKKKPIDISASDYMGQSSLSEACQDYLKIEYQSNREEALSHYSLPVKERVMTGKSVPIEVKDVEIKDGLMIAECKTIYSEIGFSNPSDVAEATRVKSGSSGGSWMICTPIQKENGIYTEEVDKPKNILNYPTTAVQEFEPGKGHIVLKSYPSSGKAADEYREWHKSWDKEKNDKVHATISEGDKFILDPQVDSITSERADLALSNIGKTDLYNTLESMRKGNNTKPETDIFSQSRNQKILDWFVENGDPSPNKKQQEFIKSINSKFCILQGPPGTGKTAGALSHALLSRLYSMEGRTNCIVTGASNKSIDEVMEDVSNCMDNYDGNYFDNTSLIRLTGSSMDEELKNVQYINYNSQEDGLKVLKDRLTSEDGGSQTKLGGSNSTPNNIIFATPSTMNKIAGAIEDSINAEQAYEFGLSVFDLLAVDEASMMTMPSFLNAGMLMREDFQVLISGDQRQMPPVRKHDWLSENRKNINKIHPYLSALDYMRYLRGEDIEYMEEDSPHSVDISVTRLNTTYRCHKKIAGFLKKWVYSKDNIDYKSEVSHTLPETDCQNSVIKNHVLEPETPLVLILHDDIMSQQSNPLEAELCSEIEKNIPESQTSGIVTPHNAQKGLLNSKCTDRTNVDTVERFQGGQKDVIMISSTVSDSDYLKKESEFILNPNRLNVALSRMKKKLIVVAPKSLFRMIPNDVDEYDRSLIWKGLQKELSVKERDPDWEGSDYEIINENMGNNIEIYKS
mgnify:CR=1 FL=1